MHTYTDIETLQNSHLLIQVTFMLIKVFQKINIHGPIFPKCFLPPTWMTPLPLPCGCLFLKLSCCRFPVCEATPKNADDYLGAVLTLMTKFLLADFSIPVPPSFSSLLLSVLSAVSPGMSSTQHLQNGSAWLPHAHQVFMGCPQRQAQQRALGQAPAGVKYRSRGIGYVINTIHTLLVTGSCLERMGFWNRKSVQNPQDARGFIGSTVCKWRKR